jgi:calcineurin-like phosphoesterase family protein/2'-5' RNA ligase
MLIEIRIGPGKRKISDWISYFCDKCQIPANKIHRVPHISLYGNFSASHDQIERVKTMITSIGRKYSFLPFLIDGLHSFEGEKGIVIYFNIVPSEDLKRFRRELVEKLISIVPDTKPYDFNEDFLFHSTLAYKLSDSEYERISTYVNSIDASSDDFIMPYFYLPMFALRITLLSNQSRIICEYDLLQQKLLSRSEALNKREWQTTSKIFRIQNGLEGNRENTNSIYLISDLHLGHGNIIHYCARPFVSSDVKEMNSVLVENWNNVVHQHNTVYCLGDLSYSRRRNSTEYWLSKLNGDIHYIKGNHHDEGVKIATDYEILHYQQYKFLLVHNPDQLPISWNDWKIHGHKHNNDMKNFPFINGEKKTINVSAELVNYRPVNLDFIISLDLNSISRMDTIDSVPQRKY